MKARKRIGRLLHSKDRLIEASIKKYGFARIELVALGIKTIGLRNFR